MLTNTQIITLMRSLFNEVYYSTLVWEGIRDRSLERPERFSSCPEADRKASFEGSGRAGKGEGPQAGRRRACTVILLMKPPHSVSVPTDSSCMDSVPAVGLWWVAISLPAGGSEVWVAARLSSVIGMPCLNVSFSQCATGDADVIATL